MSVRSPSTFRTLASSRRPTFSLASRVDFHNRIVFQVFESKRSFKVEVAFMLAQHMEYDNFVAPGFQPGDKLQQVSIGVVEVGNEYDHFLPVMIEKGVRTCSAPLPFGFSLYKLVQEAHKLLLLETEHSGWPEVQVPGVPLTMFGLQVRVPPWQ